MKSLYFMPACVLFWALGSIGYSQIQELPIQPSIGPNSGQSIKTDQPAERKGGDLEVFWSEDFSNGFDGQGDNGQWTLDAQELWFYTFPEELPDGYDSENPLTTTDEYGDFLPNYFLDREVVMSETRDNGLMMIDADRFNSTSLAADDDPGPNTTSNPISAFLISPQIDLTGVEFANIEFTQFLRLCCLNASFVTVDFSTDDGDSWFSFDAFTDYGVVNADIETEVVFNISSVLQQGADDLTQCRMRFNFSGDPTHYFWMVDDIKIVALPEDELVSGRTFYNNFYDNIDDYNAATIESEEYYQSFELHSNQERFNRIYNFGMVVANEGTEIQTGVILEVTVESPSGVTTVFESDPIDIEQGVTDTLEINGIDLSAEDILEVGMYMVDYNVMQNEIDQNPENNVGNSRQFFITEDVCVNDTLGGITWNGANQYNGTYSTLGQDVIWSTPYIYPESTEEGTLAITHVEAALLFAEGFAETQVGEIIYFNVRQGHIFDENPDDPETITTVFFDSENPLEYEASELEYEIQEGDIWNTADGGDFVFASFELPSPILIEPNTIYCAEYRVPPAGNGIVYPPITLGQETYSGLLYDFADGGWFHLGQNSINTRFRTCTVVNTDDISYESGIALNQNYPNPAIAETRIQFKTETSRELTFQVHDIAGKLIYSEYLGVVPAQNVVDYMYDVSDLAPGVYTYSIISADIQLTRKMIVE
jgi:hypothetical protein